MTARNIALLTALTTIAIHAAETASPATSTDSPAAVPPRAALVSSMEDLDDKHKLATGDRLSFRIIEDQEDPKQVVVSDLGDVELPYIGRFPALNKTCRQLAGELKVELEKKYYYQATVIVAVDVMNKSRGRVYLVGELRMAGAMEIPSDEEFTLSKAILRAGGFTKSADKKSVKVTRKGSSDVETKTFTVNLVDILEKGQTRDDLLLEPGDLIFVPSRAVNFNF